jgi:hypothetical protein
MANLYDKHGAGAEIMTDEYDDPASGHTDDPA